VTAGAAPPAAAGRAHPAKVPGPWTPALASAVALAVAMGIGRFAFTPILPMMLADGVVDLHAASWLATANYLGYLVGALLCTAQPWIWRRMARLPAIDGPWMVRAGLVATGVLTLGMALPWPAAWPPLRFAAGVASAFVFVYTSGWCLALLARLDATRIGGVMYTGPGAGIVASGLVASALVAAGQHATTGWLLFGVLAFVLTAGVWRIFREDGSATSRAAAVAGPPASAPANDASGHDERRAGAPPAVAHGADGAHGVQGRQGPHGPHGPHGRPEIAWLAFAYGLAGFGYIVTATFLPVIARAALPGSSWLDLFWPIVGLGVIAGALLATRIHVTGDLRLLLAACYVMQAVGVVLGAWWPTLGGFVLGSVLLGIPFTAITFYAMQEVRLVRPTLVASTMGLLTALYGIGQIVGPPFVALILRHSASTGAGFDLALEAAAGALVVGAAIFLAMSRVWPKPAH
jgi:hypothetical protein